jgi:methylmalonyl-CoA mutase C-terminal domain/subunit
VPLVIKQLKEQGKSTKVVIGGIIPSDEVPELMEMGVSGVFGPDTPTEDVIQCITA